MNLTLLSDADLHTILTRSWRLLDGDRALLERLSRLGIRSPARSLLFMSAIAEQDRRLSLKEARSNNLPSREEGVTSRES